MTSIGGLAGFQLPNLHSVFLGTTDLKLCEIWSPMAWMRWQSSLHRSLWFTWLSGGGMFVISLAKASISSWIRSGLGFMYWHSLRNCVMAQCCNSTSCHGRWWWLGPTIQFCWLVLWLADALAASRWWLYLPSNRYWGGCQGMPTQRTGSQHSVRRLPRPVLYLHLTSPSERVVYFCRFFAILISTRYNIMSTNTHMLQ